jgi:hypothetical protein
MPGGVSSLKCQVSRRTGFRPWLRISHSAGGELASFRTRSVEALLPRRGGNWLRFARGASRPFCPAEAGIGFVSHGPPPLLSSRETGPVIGVPAGQGGGAWYAPYALVTADRRLGDSWPGLGAMSTPRRHAWFRRPAMPTQSRRHGTQRCVVRTLRTLGDSRPGAGLRLSFAGGILGRVGSLRERTSNRMLKQGNGHGE